MIVERCGGRSILGAVVVSLGVSSALSAMSATIYRRRRRSSGDFEHLHAHSYPVMTDLPLQQAAQAMQGLIGVETQQQAHSLRAITSCMVEAPRPVDEGGFA